MKFITFKQFLLKNYTVTNTKMSFYIYGIEKLEELMNDRIYIDKLVIFTSDVNHLLKHLTDLTHLEFEYYYDQPIDLSSFNNLVYLKFGLYYDQKIDLSNLVNLKHLEFGYNYNQQTDLSKLSNLTCLKFGKQYNQPTDFSFLSNLENLEIGEYHGEVIDEDDFFNNDYHLSYVQLTDLSKCTKLISVNKNTGKEINQYLNRLVNNFNIVF